MENTGTDHTARLREAPPTTIPSSHQNDATVTSDQFREHDLSHSNQATRDDPEASTQKSTTEKIKDTLKKPFTHDKEIPPKLQEAIDVMEARREATAQKMEAPGQDPSVLSGKRKDILKEQF